MKIIADDGTEFDSVESCLAHEATLPYLKLFAEVEAAVAQDAAFAGKIEALAGKLRRERYDRGEHKFRRTRAAPDPTQPFGSKSSGATTRQSNESDSGSSQIRPDAREGEAA
jgi:hypothetical protein